MLSLFSGMLFWKIPACFGNTVDKGLWFMAGWGVINPSCTHLLWAFRDPGHGGRAEAHKGRGLKCSTLQPGLPEWHHLWPPHPILPSPPSPLFQETSFSLGLQCPLLFHLQPPTQWSLQEAPSNLSFPEPSGCISWFPTCTCDLLLKLLVLQVFFPPESMAARVTLPVLEPGQFRANQDSWSP